MAGRPAADVAFYCPVPSPDLIKRRLKTEKYALTSIGLEKRCTACAELWPADSQFFFPAKNSPTGLHCYCKACYMERKYPERYTSAA